MDVSATANNISAVIATDGNLGRSNQTAIRQAAAQMTLEEIGTALGKDKTFMSRFFSGEEGCRLNFDQVLALMEAIQVQVVQQQALKGVCIVSEEVWSATLKESAGFRMLLSEQAGKHNRRATDVH